jgi:hypothetical protein
MHKYIHTHTHVSTHGQRRTNASHPARVLAEGYHGRGCAAKGADQARDHALQPRLLVAAHGLTVPRTGVLQGSGFRV